MKAAIINLAHTNKKAVVISGILCVAGIWISVAVIHTRRTKRDQLAVAFFSELQRNISPGTVGLVESNAFNIEYWQTISKKLKKTLYFLTTASAMSFAKDIRDSYSILGDNEDKIKGVFRALKDQVQVSQVAFSYYTGSTEKINLIDDLISRLSTSEVGEIMNIVKKLPEYRVVETKKK